MSQSTLSVALATYNGERWLETQLESIATQTRPPDELVVVDDASTDRTVQILHRYADAVSFDVKVIQQETNSGSTSSFQKALEQCKFGLIALADQDDRWHPTKLEKLERALIEYPDAPLVFSNARIVDEQLNPTGKELWETLGLDDPTIEQLESGSAVKVLLKRFAITGMTMVFRRKHVAQLLPINSAWIHDGWIAFLLSLEGRFVALREPLTDYRQHPRQQVGMRSLWQLFWQARKQGDRHLEKHVLMTETMIQFLKERSRLAENTIAELKGKRNHLVDRLSRRKSIFTRWLAMGDLQRYRQFGLGWKSILQDILT